MTSSAAECGQDDDFGAVVYRGIETAHVADALPIHEDVHVRTDLAELRHDAVAQPRALVPEHRQGILDGSCLTMGADIAAIPRELAQRAGDDEVHGHHGTMAALTATTGGSASAIDVQDRPSSADPNSLPLRVPKKTPTGSKASTVIASRSTVSKASLCGRPSVMASQRPPASRVVYTRSLPSGVQRNWSDSSGTIQA